MLPLLLGMPGRFRQDIDHPTNGIRTMDRGGRPLQDLDALNFRQMQGDVSVEMSGERIVQPNTIDHYQHLLEGAAPDDDIRLRTLWSALLHLNTRQISQHLIHRCDGQFAQLRSMDRHHIPARLPLMLGLQRRGDHDRVKCPFLRSQR